MSDNEVSASRLALRWVEDEDTRLLPLATDRPLLLGRDPDCDAVFAHQTVSRRHAMVFLREGRAFLRPLSQVSPTWLGGRLVLGDAPLRPGDRMQLAIVAVELVELDDSVGPPAARGEG
jgi:pilus assembly protein CpaF